MWKNFKEERKKLEEDLPRNTSMLNKPIAFKAIAQFGDSTWRLQSPCNLAAIAEEDISTDRQPPKD